MSSIKSSEKPKKYKALPLTVSIETVGGISTPLVLRGSPLPARRQQTFSTASDNQEAVDINIFLGERPIAGNNLRLTKLLVKGIPKSPKGVPQIVLSIEVNEDCSIKAEAFEEKSGTRISVESHDARVKLTEETINKLLNEAEINKSKDEEKIKSIEHRNRVKELIYQAENVLQDQVKRQKYDVKEIEKALADLGLAVAVDSGQPDEIIAKANRLENLLTLPSLLGIDFGNLFSPLSFSQTTRPARKNKFRKTPKSSPENITKETIYGRARSGDQLSAGPIRYDIGRIFGSQRFTPDPNLCFVLMPFDEELADVYEDHIKPVVESQGISCQRADEIVGTNLITFDIWEKVNRARFIISDLTGKNPNVFYEVGLAHAIGKEVILITQTMDDVPFDLKALRCIVYSFTPRGMKLLENKLAESIQKLMRSS